MRTGAGALPAVARGFCQRFCLRTRAFPLRRKREDYGTAAARLLASGGPVSACQSNMAGVAREDTLAEVRGALARVWKRCGYGQAREEGSDGARSKGAGMNAEWARLFQELHHAS